MSQKKLEWKEDYRRHELMAGPFMVAVVDGGFSTVPVWTGSIILPSPPGMTWHKVTGLELEDVKKSVEVAVQSRLNKLSEWAAVTPGQPPA